MGRFTELGQRMDQLTERVRLAAQHGVGRSSEEARDWRRYLDELGDRIRQTTQEGLGRFRSETKGLGQAVRTRPQLWQKQRELKDKYEAMGRLAYDLHRQFRIGNPELKKMGGQITRLIREIEELESVAEKEEGTTSTRASTDETSATS